MIVALVTLKSIAPDLLNIQLLAYLLGFYYFLVFPKLRWLIGGGLVRTFTGL